MRPTRLAGIALVLLLGSVAAPTTSAAAQQDGPDVAVELASQTAWVPPEGEMVLRLDLEGRDVPPPPAGPDEPVSDPNTLDLVVEVHDRVRSRSGFGLTLEGSNLGRALSTTRAPLAGLGRDATGAVVVRLGITAGGGAPPPDGAPPRLLLNREGVYPVNVQVQSKGRTIDSLVTHLIRVPAGDDVEPLKLAMVVPVHARPAVDDRVEGGLPAEDRRRLAGLVDALAGVSLAKVMLAPTPETVDAIAASDDDELVQLLARLRSRAAVTPVLAGPYVPVDPLELTAAGLQEELGAQLAVGADTLERVLRVTPASGTWLARTPVESGSISALRQAGIRQLVVDESTLEPLDLPITLTRPFLLEGELGRRSVALAPDPSLAAHLRSGDSPVLAAHRFLADIAVLFFDEPAASRAVVALAPEEWAPSPEMVEVLLAGLADSPIVDLVDLDAAAASPLARTRDGDALVRRPLVVDPPTASALDGIRAVRRSLRSAASMVPPGTPALADVERLLLAAQSLDLTGSQQSTLVAAAAAALDRQLSLVEVPARRTITLTARTGEIPVTVRSDAPYPVEVVVSLDADQLGFPRGQSERVTLPGGNTTVRFSVEARTSGAFPLQVRVTSPDGELVLGETRYTIRSTVVSGVGLVLTGTSVAFLVAWWAVHLRRERSRKAQER